MAVEVVAGAPFSGKARYVRQEIERREAAGELGLIALDWSAALPRACSPVNSPSCATRRYRTPGRRGRPGPRMTSWSAPSRPVSLSGYILTQSPRRADRDCGPSRRADRRGRGRPRGSGGPRRVAHEDDPADRLAGAGGAVGAANAVQETGRRLLPGRIAVGRSCSRRAAPGRALREGRDEESV